MSPITSSLFIFICISILTIRPSNLKVLKHIGGISSLLVFIISSVLLLGYLYKAPLLYGSQIIPVSLPTAICFWLFSITLFRIVEFKYWTFNLINKNPTEFILLKSFLPIVVLTVILQGFLITNFSLQNNNPTLSVAFILISVVALTVIIVFNAASIIGGRLQKAEQALNETGKKLLLYQYSRSLIEASLDPLVTINADGKITDVNKATEDATGYSRDSLIGTDFSDYFTEPDKARLGYKKVFEKGYVTDYPLTLRHTSNKFIDVLYNASIYRDMKGNILGVFAAARDITEQKRSTDLLIANKELAIKNREKEKRERELLVINKELEHAKENETLAKEKYFKLYNLAPSCYFTLTREDEIVEVNQSGASILGVELHSLKNRRFGSFVSDDTKPIFNRFLENVFSTKVKEECEVILTANFDLPKYVYLIGLASENEAECLVNMFDITANKKAENIINQNVGAWELSLIEGTTWHSLKHAKIFGYETIQENWSFDIFMEHVIPDDQEFVKEKFDRALATGTDFSFECRICRIDSINRWIWVNGKPILNNRGETLQVDGIVQDITERKQIELDLIKAKEKAEESERLKSAFLTNMSHEIRTPMNGILGFAELLKEPSLTTEEQQDFVKIIGKSGERMLNTINNIVDISKIESGLMKVDIKETDVNEKIEFTYKFFKPEVETKGLKLLYKNSLPTREAIIYTDNERVYGVLTNLVKNAIKFTNEGSIEFGYKKKGGFLEFYVKDSGIGIPEYQKTLIFERFRQGSDSSTRGYEGSGLGLSISKSYVEMLGGKIWMESEVGKGSTFYFTIPYNVVTKEKLEMLNSIPTGLKEVPLKSLKILIVEDDEVSYSLLNRIVQKISKEVIHAITGIEAIEACRKNPDLDLVLMDIRMPEMDGCEATRQIRQFKSDLIIIAQTAYGFIGDREIALEAGCTDYISKPIDETLLYELIIKHLSYKNSSA